MTSDHIQGISRSLIFLGLLLVCTIVASLVATVLSTVLFDKLVLVAPGEPMPTDDASWWQLHFQNLCSQALGFGGAVWLAILIWNRSTLQGLPGAKSGRRASALVLAILATVASGPLLMASYELNGALIPEGSLLERMFLPMEEMVGELTAILATAEGMRRIVVLLGVAVLPAIFEELSFRGVLQPLLIRATGSPFWGIALASILFSAIHVQFYGFLPRVLLGALFGWLAYRSRSVVPGMVAHFANNALAAATLWATGSMTEDLLDLTPLVLGVGTVLTAATLWGFHRVNPRSIAA